MDSEVKVVLLTGGSSGIGAATAHLLAKAGMKVYAGSRRGSIDYAEDGVQAVVLDINDQAGTAALVEDIIKREGRLDAVVCCAGNGIYGPLEGTSDAEVRYQFETNFFGSVKTVQACLPYFRAAGAGRIITVTSVMAILPLPFQSLYAAAKSALLFYTEGLQMELKGSGIQCCSVLPGDVATGFTAARRFTEGSKSESSPYKEMMQRNLEKIEKDELSGMKPEVIGKAILKQLRRKKMRIRVIPRIDYGLVGLLVRLLPAKWRMALVNFLYT